MTALICISDSTIPHCCPKVARIHHNLCALRWIVDSVRELDEAMKDSLLYMPHSIVDSDEVDRYMFETMFPIGRWILTCLTIPHRLEKAYLQRVHHRFGEIFVPHP